MKHCVITGAADGIGKALALRFAAQGYAVTGIDCDPRRSLITRGELPGRDHPDWIPCDLASATDLEKALEALGRLPEIDVFIHNAGINRTGRFIDSKPEDLHALIDINLRAPVVLTHELVGRGLLKDGASLIFVSSLSHFLSYPGASLYAATKDGLTSYARSLQASLGYRRVHVMTVFPGPTRTEQARRCSPDNSREERRMPTEALAAWVWRAFQARRASCVPGLSNQLMMRVGRWFPQIAGSLMRRLIFEKLP